MFDRALQIDPNDADALNGTALTYFFDFIYGWGDPGTDYEANVLGQASRAIGLDPDNVRAYYIKAFYLALSRRANEALGAADAGLAINPNIPVLYQARAVAENSLGGYEQAKADLERAMRISPRDPAMSFWHVDFGDAEINLGHFEAAIDEYRSTWVCRGRISSTQTWPPPTRIPARWMRRRPNSPKPAGSTPQSRSSG